MNDAKPSSNLLLQHLLSCRSEIYGYIRSMVRSSHDAEDIFQEVALVVVKRDAEDPGSVENVRAWAKTVALHKVQQFCTQQRTARARELPSPELLALAEAAFMRTAAEPAELEAQHEALRHCLERVPAPVREAVRLRFVEDRGYDEIAGIIAKTEVATRRLVARTRLALLECVRSRISRPPGIEGP